MLEQNRKIECQKMRDGGVNLFVSEADFVGNHSLLQIHVMRKRTARHLCRLFIEWRSKSCSN